MAANLDKTAILENFMDDEELLFESIDLFLDRIRERIETLKTAVAEKDVEGVMVEAHTIKGMVGIFSTGAAFEAAKKLEQMGRDKNIDGAPETLADFLKESDDLVVALRDWRNGA